MEFRGIVRRVAGAGAVAAAAATLLFGGVSGAATAATGAGEVGVAADAINIKHASTRACLDSDSIGKVYTRNCEAGNRNQRWENYTLGKFRNVATGRCLGSDGAAIFTTACTSASTKWTTTSGSPKYFEHVPTGICMHNRGGHGEAVGQAACGSATRWSTVAAG